MGADELLTPEEISKIGEMYAGPLESESDLLKDCIAFGKFATKAVVDYHLLQLVIKGMAHWTIQNGEPAFAASELGKKTLRDAKAPIDQLRKALGTMGDVPEEES